MIATAPGDANAVQKQLWNGTLGEIWRRRQDQFDAVLGPAGMATIGRAAIKAGERVIDVGCGCGATTIEILRLVEPGGEVLGVDISGPMLAEAYRRIGTGKPVKFIEADAAIFQFPHAHYDVLFSRFGVMFFGDPASAFANMRRALRPGGRLAFACFRPPKESPYLMIPLSAVHQHQPPLPPLPPDAPGMFSFADPVRLRPILQKAGFEQIEIAALDVDLDIGAGMGLDAAVAISMELGPSGNALMGKTAEQRQAVANTMRSALLPYQRGEKVPLAAGLWIVTGRSP